MTDTQTEEIIYVRRKISKNSKVTPDIVREIRKAYAEGTPQKNLAEKYGIKPAAVSHIITRRRWAYVD